MNNVLYMLALPIAFAIFACPVAALAGDESKSPKLTVVDTLRAPTDSEKSAWFERVRRRSTFAQLIRQYDVIGMKQEVLMSHMGPPDAHPGWSYYLTAGGCANGDIMLQFDMVNGVVRGWREHSRMGNEPWIRTKVDYEPYALLRKPKPGKL